LKEERTLSQALTVQYDKVVFILEPSEQAQGGDRQAGHPSSIILTVGWRSDIAASD
jgi:hypothetical protein